MKILGTMLAASIASWIGRYEQGRDYWAPRTSRLQGGIPTRPMQSRAQVGRPRVQGRNQVQARLEAPSLHLRLLTTNVGTRGHPVMLY